jgi:hypothetical protein
LPILRCFQCRLLLSFHWLIVVFFSAVLPTMIFAQSLTVIHSRHPTKFVSHRCPHNYVALTLLQLSSPMVLLASAQSVAVQTTVIVADFDDD